MNRVYQALAVICVVAAVWVAYQTAWEARGVVELKKMQQTLIANKEATQRASQRLKFALPALAQAKVDLNVAYQEVYQNEALDADTGCGLSSDSVRLLNALR